MPNLLCTTCGNDCCITIAAPTRLHIDTCCPGLCVRTIRIKPNSVLKAGTILGPIDGSPLTYSPFSATATDGTQKAKLILAHDVVTDENGRIQNNHYLPGSCGPYTVEAYACGLMETSQIIGDRAAAAASGMPIRDIDGQTYLGM